MAASRDDEDERQLFDSFAVSHEAGYSWSTRSGYLYCRRRELVEKLLADLPGERLLDVGCGTGPLAPVVREAGLSYHGVDISLNMIEVARRTHGRTDRVRFSIGRVEQLDHEPNSYDVVLALGVLEYVPRHDLPRAVAELTRVLRPGGTMIISLLNRTSPIWLARWLRGQAVGAVERVIDNKHTNTAPELLFSRRQIHDLLEQPGLRHDRTTPYGLAIVPSRIYDWNPAWWARQCSRLERNEQSHINRLALAHLATATKAHTAAGQR